MCLGEVRLLEGRLPQSSGKASGNNPLSLFPLDTDRKSMAPKVSRQTFCNHNGSQPYKEANPAQRQNGKIE